jgi:hypothetical protein
LGTQDQNRLTRLNTSLVSARDVSHNLSRGSGRGARLHRSAGRGLGSACSRARPGRPATTPALRSGPPVADPPNGRCSARNSTRAHCAHCDPIS